MARANRAKPRKLQKSGLHEAPLKWEMSDDFTESGYEMI